MKYYIFTPASNPKFMSIKNFNLDKFDYVKFISEEVKKDINLKNLELKYDDKKDWSDFLNSALQIYPFSKALFDDIKEFLQSIDSYSHQTITSENENGQAYKATVLFINTRVDCINREQSIFRERNGQIVSLSKLVIDEDKVETNIHLFHEKIFLPYLLISEEVKKRIESKYSGFSFINCN